MPYTCILGSCEEMHESIQKPKFYLFLINQIYYLCMALASLALTLRNVIKNKYYIKLVC